MDGPGEADRLTEVATGVSGIKWVGEHLYFISSVWPDMNWEELTEKVKARKRQQGCQPGNGTRFRTRPGTGLLMNSARPICFACLLPAVKSSR